LLGLNVFRRARASTLARHNLLGDFPMFPLCMFGGLLVRLGAERFDRRRRTDHGPMCRTQNTALGFPVVATLRLDAVATHWAPLAILVVAGIA